jgi:hypothetical protein
LYEVCHALDKPQAPIVGEPIPPGDMERWEGNPRGLVGWLREQTLALAKD